MLTLEGCQQRRDRLWAAVPAEAEWLLIADPRHVCYLSGFSVNPLSFSLHERALLLLRRDGTATLFADNFTRRTAVCDPFVMKEVIAKWYDHKNSVVNRDDALCSAFDAHGNTSGSCGIVEEQALPIAFGPLVEKKIDFNLGTALRNLRRSKHEDEVELLRKCMVGGAAGHARALEVIAPGITEFELFREVQSAAQEAVGCPAVVYGDFRANNAETPRAGGVPTHYALREGDLFILDYSVVIQGCRSDFTNTLAVGEPSAEQVGLFDACVAAMGEAEAKLAAGAKACDVYQAASSVLKDAGFGELAHHAGHGLGFGHPEAPVFGPESTDELIEGDVVTIEPGAYVPGIGGVRVEHNYLITADGSERLSNHTIKLR